MTPGANHPLSARPGACWQADALARVGAPRVTRCGLASESIIYLVSAVKNSRSRRGQNKEVGRNTFLVQKDPRRGRCENAKGVPGAS